jgi:glycyl-tRNA synthetase beta chain
MADLLLELMSEEIPARMQADASRELQSRLERTLKDAHLEFNTVTSFVTPRRLAVRVEGLPQTQPDTTAERKGPRTDAPAAAIEGFCRSAGVEKDALEIRDGVYFHVSHQQGQATHIALKPLIETVITNFPWPKSQRWGAHALTWVRPLRSIVCLLDNTIIPVTLGHITASNTTEGHRFLSQGSITIASPASYETTLRDHYVIASAAERKHYIAEQAQSLAKQEGFVLHSDDRLLDEVIGLVEWPTCYIGSFEEDFLKLPPEVLILEMRHHQKYFALKNHDGSLANRFLVVSNMLTTDGGKAVVHGNGRVLRARLSDGRFFWEQDNLKPLQEHNAGLEHMIFHAKLGTVAAKVARITRISALIAPAIPQANATHIARAATLCKADLMSGMVGEFPELQGVMGRYYALAQGEDAAIADAIRDHYKPAGAEDSLPTQPTSIAIALADKLDSLVGLFAAGEKPTGSKDPCALRRAALGIIRIIAENHLRLPVRNLFAQTLEGLASALQANKDALITELLGFFHDRLKVMLRDKNISHDIIEAVQSNGTDSEDDIVRLIARARALEDFMLTDDGENMLAGYRRAANIVTREEKKDSTSYQRSVHASLLTEDAEKNLFAQLQKVAQPIDTAIQAEQFVDAMQHVAQLRAPVDAFLDKVMVNAENPDIRINRLCLLAQVSGLLDKIANFGLITTRESVKKAA